MKKPAPTPGKRPRRSAPVRLLSLSLACLAGLSACAPGGADSADAEPAPIEVPPPVEQTNEGLTIFYTDYNEVEAKILTPPSISSTNSIPIPRSQRINISRTDYIQAIRTPTQK